MFLPLRSLDDLRWDDLVEEARGLIPLYAPEWTDHNVSDPGITFMELLAWMAEMEIFQLDQVPARHRRKFLALVGVTPDPPHPARTILRFDVAPSAPPVTIPASLVCTASVADANVAFRTLEAVTVVDSRLVSIEVADPLGARRDMTERWRRGEPFPVFGTEPSPGAAVVLGFDHPFPVGVPVQMAVTTDTIDSRTERYRLATQAEAGRSRCRPPRSLTDCDWDAGDGNNTAADAIADVGAVPLTHHSVHLTWEFLSARGQWRQIEAGPEGVVDTTRAMTLDGSVVIRFPTAMSVEATTTGPRSYLRCRLARGRYDAPPLVRDIALNGVEAEQSVPSGVTTWPIRPDATIIGSAQRGATSPVSLRLERGRVTYLDFEDLAGPPAFVIDYRPPPDKGAVLALEVSALGPGDGRPNQALELPAPPVDADSVRIASLRPAPGRNRVGPSWRRWVPRLDFDASRRADAHVVVDPATGTVIFGDGEHGMALPDPELVVAWCGSTTGEFGNLAVGTVNAIAATPHNAALLAPSGALVASVTNPVPGTGGEAAESLEDAEARALQILAAANRAVTVADYEDLALQTPGVRLARVAARANLHPGFPCVGATGVMTLIVVPYLPTRRPVPTPGLLRLVAAQIEAFRIVGTRVIVTGPRYTEIRVRTRVRGRPGTRRPEIDQLVVGALDRFLDPLVGGPDGTGWPFGRDVVESELLHVIGNVPGVDHVAALELAADGTARCGNVCIGAVGLVVAGSHEVEVE